MAINATQQAIGIKPVSDVVDAHAVPQYHPTFTQQVLFTSFVIAFTVWLLNCLSTLSGLDIFRRGRFLKKVDPANNGTVTEKPESLSSKHQIEPQDVTSKSEVVIVPDATDISENIKERMHNGTGRNENKQTNTPPTSSSPKQSGNTGRPSLPPPVSGSQFLSSVVMFGVIMAFFYLCDYVKIFPQGERHYSRDIFLFLVFLFFLVACAFTIRTNEDKILNREQTEEWKGWMQVMFVWYHYFKAKEWYNWIRVYIACYVWMTGFGNFSFFWVRNDFSLLRFMKMLFRLNFLVIFVAMVTNNQYMLYYICAMHTYWFLSVYVFMRVLNSWNRNRQLMALKFLAYAVCNAIIFDIPGFSGIVFRPLWFILGLDDNSGDIMHEWSFRAGLDHWACFFGMLCAYNYPHFEAFMLYLDSKTHETSEEITKKLIRVGMGVACVLLGVVWYFSFMQSDKYTYNRTHPYTSIIPILIFIVARNLHPVLRTHHIHLFAWLGKITLETYLSQLHVYLLSNARSLLLFLPDYHLLNFAMATIVYLVVSHRLFLITNDCSSFLLPNDSKKLMYNGICLLAFVVISLFATYLTSML